MSGQVQATVLIPTHDHGPLLRLAAESALAQTVSDLEVLIVGDGVPDVTREIVAELARGDHRVRFFDNPKGPRHGEVHRHAALAEARGHVVAYLSDDDLWLPDHVELMVALLGDADFASAVALKVQPDGGLTVRMNNFANPRSRMRLMAGERGVSLSCGAHRLALYRELPHGWRTTPPGIETDKYMWQQLLADPSRRAATATRPTVVSLPSPPRKGMTAEERLQEMCAWRDRLADPVERGELYARACQKLLTDLDWREHKDALAQLRSPATRLREAVKRLARGFR